MKKITLSLVLLAFVCMYSFKPNNAIAQAITIESEQIPPDMATEEFILIGKLHNKHSYDKHLKKEFSSYTGKYILATQEELKTNYTNKAKYRYILDCEVEEREKIRGSGINASIYIKYIYRYYIFDRSTGETFTRIGDSGNAAREIRVYLKAIEAIRKK